MATHIRGIRIAVKTIGVIGPLLLMYMAFIRPISSPLEQKSFDQAACDGLAVSSTDLTKVIRAPMGNGSWRRLIFRLDLDIHDNAAEPVRLEIRDTPTGSLLASKHLTKTQSTVPESVKVNCITRFSGDAYILLSGINIDSTRLMSFSIEDTVASAYDNFRGNNLAATPESQYIVLLFLFCLGIWFLIGPWALMRSRRRNIFNNRETYGDGWPAKAILAGILAISSLEAIILFVDVILPCGPSYRNGAWTGVGYFVGLPNALESPFLLYFGLWPPGSFYFYGIMSYFLKLVSFSCDDLFFTEISYRLIQYVIVLTSICKLYFFLVNIFRRNLLPGEKYFPLLAVALLSLHPDLVLCYLTPTQHALFVPILIALVILADRLTEESNKAKSAILFGLTGAAAILWRDELKLVPFAFLGIVFLSSISYRAALKTCARACLVMAAPLLLLMTANAKVHGHFDIHQANHGGIALLDYLGAGAPDNALGVVNDDFSNVRVGYWNNTSNKIDEINNGKAMQSLFFKGLSLYPSDYIASWLARLPGLYFDLGSRAVPNLSETLSLAFFPPISFHLLGILVLCCIPALFFTLAALPQVSPLLMLPAVYGLGVVGFLASGVGYFSYIYLSFACIFPIGLAKIFQIATNVFATDFKIPANTSLRPRIKTPFAVVILSMALLLWVSMIAGVDGYRPGSFSYTSPWAAHQEQNLAALMSNYQNVGPNLVWRRSFSVTSPYVTGNMPVHNGLVYINQHGALSALSTENGETATTFPYPTGPGNVSGFFMIENDMLVLPYIEQNGRQRLKIIDLTTNITVDDHLVRRHVYGNIVTDGQRLYYPTLSGGKFHLVLQAISGETDAWERKDLLFFGAATYADNRLFFGTASNGRLIAADKTTGKSYWEYHGRSPSYAAPLVAGSTVYYMDNSGHVYALDAINGSVLTETSVPGTFPQAFALHNGILLLGSYEGGLFALNSADLKLLWRTRCPGAILAQPAFRDGFAYVASGPRLLKIDLASGKTVWTYALGAFARDVAAHGEYGILVRVDNSVLYLIDTPIVSE